MSSGVLDASALLALLNGERGSDTIAGMPAGSATMSAVNLSEVVAKLAESGMPSALIHRALEPLGIDVVAFDTDLAYQAGMLRPATKASGLSFGDRACLALAQSVQLSALTADRTWADLRVGVEIRLAR